MSPLLSPQLTWLRLRWPRELVEGDALAALRALNGLSRPHAWGASNVVLEVAGNGDGIEQRLAVRAEVATAVTHQLREAVAGLVVEAMDRRVVPRLDCAWAVWLSTRRRPLDVKHSASISAGLLAAVAGAEAGELVVTQWLLGPVRRPTAVPAVLSRETRRLPSLPLRAPADLDAAARRSLADKQGEPGWRALGRIAVAASGRRRQLQLLSRVSAALRTAQAPDVQIGVYRTWARTVESPIAPLYYYPLALNVSEVLALSGWPLGETPGLPVQRLRSRPLPPARVIPRHGRVVADATYPGSERPLALSERDAMSHLHVLGPTGTGKSTLLLRLITSDIAAGHSVVVIEPKNQLIADVLERVPAHRHDDVVIIDPADESPVGINPLHLGSRPAELVVDQLLPVFRRLYESWGPRLQEILHCGLLTLAASPNSTLPALIPLYADAAFRAPYVARVQHDLALASFWNSFARMSDAERNTSLLPVLSRLRAFLLRPRLRAVLGQANPRFDLQQVFRRPTILLVDLSKGALGPLACNLLGGLIISQLWHAVLGRAALRPEQRRPVFCYFDEWQDYVHLSTDLADALAQARGLDVGLTLAHQLLAQLDPALRSAVLANARSRVIGRLAYDDAALVVRGQKLLEVEDITNLGAFEVYVQLLANGTVTPFASAQTAPPPPVCADATELRSLNRRRFGVPAVDVEAALRSLMNMDGAAPDTSHIGFRLREEPGA